MMPWTYKWGNVAGTAIIHPRAVLGEGVELGQNVIIHADVRIGTGAVILDGSVIGRAPRRPMNMLRERLGTFIGEYAVIGTNCTIYDGVMVGGKTLIGDGVRIREDCRIGPNCIIGSNCTFQNEVVMEDGSRVVDLSHITAGVRIGEGAFVSTGVLTMNDDSFNGNNPEAPAGHLQAPSIGAFSSIGGGAILLPGVSIGRGAVVAAGSIVTKSAPERSLVMGVAASIKKHDLSYDGMPSPRGDREDD